MSKKLAVLFALALLVLPQLTTATDGDAQSFAYDTVQYSIAALLGPALPPDAHSAVTNAPFLALDFLEHAESHESIELIALAGALHVDGALSEAQNCVVLRLSQRMQPSLAKAVAEPERLVDECRRRAIGAGVSPTLVCVTASVARDRAARQIEAISRHERCSE